MIVPTTATTNIDHWSASKYKTNASYVPEMTTDIISLLQPNEQDEILDIGCGDGVLTRRFAMPVSQGGFGFKKVVGVDASPDMIQSAKDGIPAGIKSLEYQVWDGQNLENFSILADQKFTSVFSNAALHWMKCDPEAVIRGVRKALIPGGRFIAEFGGHMNVATVHMSLIAALKRRGIDGVAASPWYFPTAREYQTLLDRNGFTQIQTWSVPRQTPLPQGLSGFLDTFAGPFMIHLPDDETREIVKREVVEECQPVLMDREGNWTLDYVRLRVVAFAV
ncbi:hypothetical protein HDU76_000807 [Blyttiomyces sp. JEL0837]|nr:hypothetical protein HDU76_000807 [Blyttiomyces sp. JEL0837]